MQMIACQRGSLFPSGAGVPGSNFSARAIDGRRARSRDMFRSEDQSGSLFWPPRRNAAEHSAGADIFIDVRPMNALAVSHDIEMISLGGCGFRQAPGPGEGNGDYPTVSEGGRDGIVGHDY